MKKFVGSLFVCLLLSGCYQNDIDDLKKKYDDLKSEQDRQAALLATYQGLLQALEKKLTINSVSPTENGYKIVFSDGSEMFLTDGKTGHTPVITVGDNGNWFIDGVDTGKPSVNAAPKAEIIEGYWYINGVNTGVKAVGADAPYIIGVVEADGLITFYMSDGSSVTMQRTRMQGLYVLSEGSWGKGDGQLLGFDYAAASDRFSVNERKRLKNFGETPNDLLIYGSKMYCAISGMGDAGSLVRVISSATGETLRDIPVLNGSTVLQPRRLAAVNGKVYVTLYSGFVAQVDTASLALTVTPVSGSFSEGICVAGNFLYVCNSGQGEGNTLSVVSLADFVEKEVITVPYNPVNVVYVGNDEIYLNTAQVWSGVAVGTPANVHVFSTVSKRIVHSFNVEVESIAGGKGVVYGVGMNWTSYTSVLKRFGVSDRSVKDFTSTTSRLSFAYKVFVHPAMGDVFVTQQMGQEINRFKANGAFVETLKTGQQNGSAVVFY